MPSSSDISCHRSSAVSPRHRYNYTFDSSVTRDGLMGWETAVMFEGNRPIQTLAFKQDYQILDVTQNLRIVLLFDRRVDRSSFTLLLPPFPF